MLILTKKLVYVAANIPRSAVQLQERKNKNNVNSETKSSSEFKTIFSLQSTVSS